MITYDLYVRYDDEDFYRRSCINASIDDLLAGLRVVLNACSIVEYKIIVSHRSGEFKSFAL